MSRGISKPITLSSRVGPCRLPLTSKQILHKVFTFMEISMGQAVRYRQAHEPGDLAPEQRAMFYHLIGHMITVLENTEINFFTDHDAVATLEAMPADSTVN